MDYTLHQRGRAAIDFLADLRNLSNRFEQSTDQAAFDGGLNSADLPEDPAQLQEVVTPIMENSHEFRVLRMCRDWTLEEHGQIAMDIFEEIRAEVEPDLKALQKGPTTLEYDENLKPPKYWDGYEFHKSAGGWDGHDYMGFVHGELIHRRMVNPTFAGMVYAVRKSVAETIPVETPAKILDVGCCSGQFTQGIAELFPDSEIWGCDLSSRQLEQAQRYANENNLAWHLFQADGADTGRTDNEFDVVASYAMFHEIPITASLEHLKEYLRILKPGGYAVVGDVKAYHTFNNYDRWKADYWNQVHGGDPFWREYASTNLADLALQAGFAEAEWKGLGEREYPFVLIARKGDNNE
ncbi:MAG: class I SAM-dependent methyltransferase [Gammaproteobacteria bacterium]|jgi:SAM-dependent methyltransferase|nr:class I SAM-dependent methyltransferase [Gammaproteobacteria bacterium]MDP6617428.1 class I SAM-dependent methyltransferase [Gammaproteobacteria bacterium]